MTPAGQWLWIAVFAGVCGVAGASVAHALGVALYGGLLAGLALGSAPAWLRYLAPGLDRTRCAEWISLLLLAVIAGTISFTGLLPVLGGTPVAIEAALSLLLMAPVLYGTYLVLNRMALAVRRVSVADRLAGALSGPPLGLSLLMAITVATCAVIAIRYVGQQTPAWEFVAAKFTQRGIIPPLTLMLFFWGLLLLGNKTWVLWRERRALSGAGGESVLMRAHGEAVQEGGIAIDGFVEMVWRKSADFYVVPRYLNWAIPILGFIGTVLGISLAADGIQGIIGSGRGLSDLGTQLGEAIAPLGIAFDTTLIALSLSVLLTFLQIGLQRWEDNILVDYENRVRRVAGQEDDAAPAGLRDA